MRAGAFCDIRVIDLLNRRFVSYYFNRSGLGQGGNPDAATFTRGKTKNQYAYYAAFKPDGTYLGETPLYGTKEEVFSFLLRLLKENPNLAKPTERESATRKNAKTEPVLCARLEEELGRYDRAEQLYASVDSPVAHLGRVRIARYRRDWVQHATLDVKLATPADRAMERAYRYLAKKKFAEAQSLLRKALQKGPASKRTAEMHFYCGVACWFLDQRDWAKFHWCWVQKNLSEDRMYMRCRIASAAEGMPYRNPELGGFKAGGRIGTQEIVAEVDRSMKVYRALSRAWEAGDFSQG